jgi:hypothetical protein
MTKRFTGVNIGDMYFNDRDTDTSNRIANRIAIMSKRTGIENNAIIFFIGRMNLLDDFPLVIALKTS